VNTCRCPLGFCNNTTRAAVAQELRRSTACILAHTAAGLNLGELEESFNKFLHEQLPKLTNDQTSTSELYDVLLDIGEEFRHIIYHIRDPKFYKYLTDTRPV